MWLTDFLFNGITLLLVALMTGFYLWVKFRYQYFEKKGIPYAKPVFLFGNMKDAALFRENIFDGVTKFYFENKTASSVMGFFRMLTPTYVITDPALANKIFIKDFSHFQDHGLDVDEEVNPLDGNLFNLKGGKWRTLRNKLTPIFTSGKLKWMFETMGEVTDHLVQHIDQNCLDRDFEVRDLLARFTTDVIGSCAFGLDPGAIKNPDSEFRQMGEMIFRPPFFFQITNLFRFFFPDLAKKLKIKTISKPVTSFFTSITKQAFEHRLKTGKNRKDFIQLLLQLREKGSVDMDHRQEEDEVILKHQVQLQDGDKTKLKFTDELLTAQSFFFFAAGFETSAGTLSWATYFMSKFPEIQERLRAEIKLKKNQYGGLTYEALKDIPLLEGCIYETMRMMSPVPVIFRGCTKPYILSDGTLIDEGAQIMIPMAAFQKDPEFFPNPEVFEPERFMPGRSVYPGSFHPFGEGPRVCIAQRFALLELKLGLAKLIDNFIIVKSPKMVEPFKMDPRSFLPVPIGGLWSRFNKAV